LGKDRWKRLLSLRSLPQRKRRQKKGGKKKGKK